MAYSTTKQQAILAKLETNYGQNALPDPLQDAIEIIEPEIKPAYEFIRNESVTPSLSKRPSLVADGTVEVSFKTYLKGSGDISVEPRIARLLQACSMQKQFIDESGNGTNDTYKFTPHSDINNQDSLTFYVYKGGMLYKIVGAKGTFNFNGEVSKFPIISFTFTGKLAEDPTFAPVPTVNLESSTPIIFKNASATLTKGSTNYTLKATKLEVGIENKVSPLKSITASDGIDSIFITERDPKGSIDPIASDSTDFFNIYTNADVCQLKTIFGNSTGNTIHIEANIQFSDFSIGDREGFATYELPFECVSETGDDELIIKIK